MITAFIASQLIGVRREVVELNARQRKTYEDDRLMAGVLIVAAAFVVGPFLWPIGMAFSKPMKRHPWLYAPYIFGVFLVLAIGFWFYLFVGFFWTLYEVLAYPAKLREMQEEKRKNFRTKINGLLQEKQEDLSEYDDICDVEYSQEFTCPCGCGYSEKVTKLKSRVNPAQ